MSSELYTFIGHRNLAFANPFGEASMQRAVEVLGLPQGASVADFGAGSCELPIRLAERYQAKVAAVELSTRMAAVAREKIHARLVARQSAGGVTVHEGDAGAFRATMEPASYDLTICIGSTHSLGGYEKALTLLKRLTRRGGQVLVGEGFWAKAPPVAFLAATGMSADEFHTHGANIDHAVQEGLTPLWSITASEREWDEYEWALARNIESLVGEKCDSAAALVARGRAWREAYWRWGRSTLGFGLYLFRV
jgi:cyclopropane fatty-acyl-phospholipid synthase-like methyltransferase